MDMTPILVALFFPGIICAYIFDALAHDKERDKFYFSLRAFVFGFLCYASLWGMTTALRCLIGWPNSAFSSFFDALQIPNAPVNYLEVALATAIAVLLGFLLVKIHSLKLIHAAGKRLAVSNRLPEQTLLKHLVGRPVYVNVHIFESNMTYCGWVGSWADEDSRIELYLRDVTVYKHTGSDRSVLFHCGGVYIAPAPGDMHIEFPSVEIDADKLCEVSNVERGKADDGTYQDDHSAGTSGRKRKPARADNAGDGAGRRNEGRGRKRATSR